MATYFIRIISVLLALIPLHNLITLNTHAYFQLRSAENHEVDFPTSLYFLSPVVREATWSSVLCDLPAEMNLNQYPYIRTSLLHTLNKCIKQFPLSARDHSGKATPSPDRWDSHTIFVHSLLKSALRKTVQPLPYSYLADLFQLSTQLQIHPLSNALAFFLAERKDSWDKQTFVKDPQHLIQKHLTLLKKNKVEQTISDFIGLHGQPVLQTDPSKKDCILNLSNQSITGLNGIQHVEKTERITEIRLNHNFLLGNDLDCFFPEKPFLRYFHVKKLLLEDNQLGSIPADLFYDMPQLTLLSLRSNKLRTLPEKVFKDCFHLDWLYLDDNQLNDLPKTLFHRLSHLGSLYLSYNQLHALDEELFRQNPKLSWLYLDHNQIAQLPKSLFHGLTHLTRVHLNNNLLSSLPEYGFRDVHHLQRIHLEQNQLKHLPREMFSHVRELQVLNIAKNKIKETKTQFRKKYKPHHTLEIIGCPTYQQKLRSFL